MPHGVSGKTTKNGVAKCELRHPKRCRKHMKFGTDPEHGCNLGDSCEFYHIPHCSSSLKDKTCYKKDCNRVHLVGTKRPKREKNTTPPGGGTRQARPQTTNSAPSQSRSRQNSTRPPPSRDGRSQRPVPNKPSEKATAENDNRFLELRTKAVVPSISRQSSASHQSRYDTSFAVMGPKLWNCVPNNLNTMVQFELFKKNLTAFLLSVPDTPPTKGYSPSNSNSILAWRVDSSAAALWGGQRS